MIILIDTSKPVCLVTIIEGGSTDIHKWEAGRELAKGLLGYLTELTGGLDRVAGIGVMKGPGSFTGLRIGLTVANTLADSLDIPIVGESGEGWQDKALQRLGSGESEQVVLPFYGTPAHITRPNK